MNLIDTNIILRFLTADENPRFKGVYELFSRLEDNLEKVELKALIFFQTIFVLKSFYKVNRKDIYNLMNDIISLPGIYMEKKSLYKRTLEIFKTENIEIIDSYLLACMEQHPDAALYSYDENFNRFDIHRVEPS